MKVKSALLAALICCLLGLTLCPAAVAGTYNTIENSPPQAIVTGMGNKAVRGIANIATGWLELPKQIYITSTEDGAAKGIFVGPFIGIGMAVVRTVTGVAEFSTFYASMPGFYDPYFQPALVWQKGDQ